MMRIRSSAQAGRGKGRESEAKAGARDADSASVACGLWPMDRRKAVFERYAALRCLWHEVGVACRAG
eukprot:5394717-Prymnesium_polylepis.1